MRCWSDDVCFVLDQHAYLDSYRATQWNNSLQVDMLHHSDTNPDSETNQFFAIAPSY
jgi:hypothetical protein